MRPSEEFARMMRVRRFCSSICGADIIDKNYKVNGITYCVGIFIAGYFTCLGYTFKLNIATNYTLILESLCMVGSGIQGATKLASGIICTKILYSQYALLKSIYEKFEAKGGKYTLVLSKSISRVRRVLQLVAGLFGLTFVTINTMPLWALAFSDRRFLPMQFYLPLLDADTDFGYYTTMGIHFICVLFGLAGNFASDMFMLVFFGHSTVFLDIFKIKVEELNESAKNSRSHDTMDRLKDVIEWHQLYSYFIEKNDVVFFWINFVEISTSGLSIVLTLVLLFISDWPGSYLYAGVAFSMLYLYCGMGTLVEIANERFTDEIYAIHWYQLTIPQQKLVQFMLMKSQSPKLITVGGVAPLAVSTGLQVTKSGYSFFMMMYNFLH